jgi:hypothetical protein
MFNMMASSIVNHVQKAVLRKYRTKPLVHPTRSGVRSLMFTAAVTGQSPPSCTSLPTQAYCQTSAQAYNKVLHPANDPRRLLPIPSVPFSVVFIVLLSQPSYINLQSFLHRISYSKTLATLTE